MVESWHSLRTGRTSPSTSFRQKIEQLDAGYIVRTMRFLAQALDNRRVTSSPDQNVFTQHVLAWQDITCRTGPWKLATTSQKGLSLDVVMKARQRHKPPSIHQCYQTVPLQARTDLHHFTTNELAQHAWWTEFGLAKPSNQVKSLLY